MSTPTSPRPQDLEVRLKSLINSAPVILFMKGDRQEPKCGFSRTITQLLNEQQISYKTFDILQDQQVREGLKKFSNWPTYPQVSILICPEQEHNYTQSTPGYPG